MINTDRECGVNQVVAGASGSKVTCDNWQVQIGIGNLADTFRLERCLKGQA